MGRKRIFFGRPYEDSVLRKAIAYNPQSSTADYLSLGILQLWNAIVHENLPVKLFGQVHDAVAFQYPEDREDEILPQVIKLLEPEIIIKSPDGTSRKFSIPVEGLSGWNLSYLKKLRDDSILNPDGLIEYKGTDERTRTKRPHTDLVHRVLY